MIVIDFDTLKLCSGCHACFNACPTKCIVMEENNAGFVYPKIDNDKCINCDLCEKVCPVLNNKNQNPDIGKAYACYNKNEVIRMQSSSGGIFTLIAENIIEKDGVVFGAAFDDNFDVRHICVETKEELSLLRGSKYVQSTIGNTYKTVKEILENGRYVLFTGTPCQIDGLLNYLGKRYDKLFTQDIICHGVPAPEVWCKYIKFRERKACSNTRRTNFRNKKHGWNLYSVQFEFENCTEYKEIFSKDFFMKGFLANLCLRESCYNCRAKSLYRSSDITLADFWGIEKVAPDLFDDKGTSLVLVNSAKGGALFGEIKSNTIYKEVDINKAVEYNPSAYKSVERPIKRDRYIKDIFKNDNFDKVVIKYTKKTLPIRIIRKIKRIIKQILNKYFGEKI